MEASELIEALGRKMGLELSFKDGAAAFEADGMTVAVNDLPALDAVALTGDIGAPPPERLESLYKTVLEAQHLFRSTHGATISLDPGTGHFALNKAIPLATVDAESFAVEVERFISTLETFVKIVREFRARPPDAEPSAPIDETASSVVRSGFGGAGFMRV